MDLYSPNRSRLLTTNPSRRLASLFLGLALAVLFFLPELVSLDERVHSWMQARRSCELDHLAFLLKGSLVNALILLGLCALFLLCLHRRWAEAWHITLVVVWGEVLCDVLKDSFARARPSALPPAFDGNSFPSSHVLAALLIAGVLGFLLARQSWTKGAKLGVVSLLAGCVFTVAWQRLYSGQHWFSDILGSVFLAGAWLCFTLPRPAVLSISWRSALAWGCLLFYSQSAFLFPNAQLPLPSAWSIQREPLLTLSFGKSTPQGLLQGAWGEHASEPVGPITWANGGEVGVGVQLPQRQAYVLKLAIRPVVHSQSFSCFPFEVSVNRQTARQLLLSQGWREYSVPIDPTWVEPGVNLISFRASAGFPKATSDPRTVAFRYVKVFPER